MAKEAPAAARKGKAAFEGFPFFGTLPRLRHMKFLPGDGM